MTRTDVIRKIRALQSKALDGTNPNECASAARKAAELMAEFKITGSDLRASNTDANRTERAPGSGRSSTNGAGARPSSRAPRPSSRTQVPENGWHGSGNDYLVRMQRENARIVQRAVHDVFGQLEAALLRSLRA